MDDLITVLRMLVCETDVLGMADPTDDDERERLAVAVIRECRAVAGFRSGWERFADRMGVPTGWRAAARVRFARLAVARSERIDREGHPVRSGFRFIRVGGKYVRALVV